jgi:AsmA protein
LKRGDPPIWNIDMKALKIAGGVIAAIVVGAIALLVVGMPAGFLTSAIQQRVERETGYRLRITGSTKLGIWPSLNVTMSSVMLEGPNDRDTGSRVAIGRVQADMTLTSLWSDKVEITELVIDHPTVSIPLRRERQPVTETDSKPVPAEPDRASRPATASAPTIKRIRVIDGRLTLFNTHDHVENHVEGIGVHATIGADRRISLDGNARAGAHPLTFNITAAMGDPSQPRQPIPAELSFEAPELLQAQLTSKAEVRLNGSVVTINGLSGTIGDGAFDGWASVDFASKPLVKLDLDFHRLDIAAVSAQGKPQDGAAATWSTEPIQLSGLNYVDAQVRLSATELNIGSAHFAPVGLEASLAGGILKATLSNVGAYGGQANGTIDIDVSSDRPVYALRSDLAGVRALPLLTSAAGFDKLDGRLQAKIDVRSSGETQQAIMSGLAGTAVANFRDGAIRGINVAQMIRSLTSGTLSGWQESRERSTDLTELSASFRIDKGQANTTDLDLVGPLVKMTGAGTVDLGAQTLALRVEPKLVMTTQGQGRTSDPVGLGIPVVIDGPWTNPRIYPDIAGILDDPDAAYAKLKQLGAGLFAPGGAGGNTGGNGQSDALGNLGAAIGNLIQQGLNQGRNNPSAPNGGDQNRPAQPDQSGKAINDMLKQFFGR